EFNVFVNLPCRNERGETLSHTVELIWRQRRKFVERRPVGWKLFHVRFEASCRLSDLGELLVDRPSFWNTDQFAENLELRCAELFLCFNQRHSEADDAVGCLPSEPTVAVYVMCHL